MKLRWVHFTVLSLAFSATGCQTGVAPLSEDDVAAINSVVESFAEAALARDWATAAGYYAVDAVFMPPNEPTFEGRAEEQARLEASPPVISFSSEAVEVHGYGDLAYARGVYSLSFLAEVDTVTVAGKWVQIFRMQPDGSWLIALDIWNLDDPLP